MEQKYPNFGEELIAIANIVEAQRKIKNNITKIKECEGINKHDSGHSLLEWFLTDHLYFAAILQRFIGLPEQVGRFEYELNSQGKLENALSELNDTELNLLKRNGLRSLTYHHDIEDIFFQLYHFLKPHK